MDRAQGMITSTQPLESLICSPYCDA